MLSPTVKELENADKKGAEEVEVISGDEAGCWIRCMSIYGVIPLSFSVPLSVTRRLPFQELLEDEDDLCSAFQEAMQPSERLVLELQRLCFEGDNVFTLRTHKFPRQILKLGPSSISCLSRRGRAPAPTT